MVKELLPPMRPKRAKPAMEKGPCRSCHCGGSQLLPAMQCKNKEETDKEYPQPSSWPAGAFCWPNPHGRQPAGEQGRGNLKRSASWAWGQRVDGGSSWANGKQPTQWEIDLMPRADEAIGGGKGKRIIYLIVLTTSSQNIKYKPPTYRLREYVVKVSVKSLAHLARP